MQYCQMEALKKFMIIIYEVNETTYRALLLLKLGMITVEVIVGAKHCLH